MATRARVSRSQVKARSPGSDAGECKETGRLGGRWASLGGGRCCYNSQFLVLLVILVILLLSKPVGGRCCCNPRFLVPLVILMLVLMWVLLVTPMFVLCKVS